MSPPTPRDSGIVSPDGTNKKRAGTIQMPASSKKGRFASVKKTPRSQAERPDDPNEPTVKVTIIKPNNSTFAVHGILITPLGFFMDKILSDTLHKSFGAATCDTFLEQTGATHRVVHALDSKGEVIKKFNNNQFYPVRSVFIPVEEEEGLQEENAKAIVNKFSDALWRVIESEKKTFAKTIDLPVITDCKGDVTTVNNWSDAIDKQEDIFVAAKMSLQVFDQTLFDWLHDPDNNNVYTLVKEGTLKPTVAIKYRVPFAKMHQDDKDTFQAHNDKIRKPAVTDSLIPSKNLKKNLTPNKGIIRRHY